jgi:hypothetical protein
LGRNGHAWQDHGGVSQPLAVHAVRWLAYTLCSRACMQPICTTAATGRVGRDPPVAHGAESAWGHKNSACCVFLPAQDKRKRKPRSQSPCQWQAATHQAACVRNADGNAQSCMRTIHNSLVVDVGAGASWASVASLLRVLGVGERERETAEPALCAKPQHLT